LKHAGACPGSLTHLQSSPIIFGLPESLSTPKIKYISLYRNSDLQYTGLSPCHHEGRFAVVTKRGAGCDGTVPASGDLHPAKRWQRSAKSCGPGAATLASIRPACAGLATVAKKAVHRGEHEVSRQTIARGGPGCPGCTCSPCPCASARGMPVRSGVRDLWVHPAPEPSPRPLSERATNSQNPGENPAAGMRAHVFTPQSTSRRCRAGPCRCLGIFLSFRAFRENCHGVGHLERVNPLA
jgi:hypothetical protein